MTRTKAQQYMQDHSRGEIRPGLSRVRELLCRLGDPQLRMSYVHAAGTNGKGSVCAMLESILRVAGYRTGLYTSPHLARVNEEIRVGGEEICDAAFTELIGRVSARAEGMADPPSRFEIMTAASILYFQEQGCRICVIETGMGGTWDATNVIPPPEVCVITNIGLDHTEYLGESLPRIAAQKAGIIKKGSAVVCYDLPPEVRRVIDESCRQAGMSARYADFAALRLSTAGEVPRPEDAADAGGAPQVTGEALQVSGELPRSTNAARAGTARRTAEEAPRPDAGVRASAPVSEGSFYYKERRWPLSLAGDYQARNAAVVLEAVWALRERGWEIPDEAVSEGLSGVIWPARFEILSRNPLVILDGGHNAQCAQAFAQSLRRYCGTRNAVILLGMLRDKDCGQVVRILSPHAAFMVCTTPPSERALPAKELCSMARAAGIDACAIPDPDEALDAALRTAAAWSSASGSESAAADGAPAAEAGQRAWTRYDVLPVAVFGSLYLAGAVRRCFGKLS